MGRNGNLIIFYKQSNTKLQLLCHTVLNNNDTKQLHCLQILQTLNILLIGQSTLHDDNH